MNDFRQIPATHPDLTFNFDMHQSLHALELPIVELAEWVRQEIDNNPLLEYTESDQDSKPHFFIDHYPNPPPTLYEHLIEQIKEILTSPQELHLAEKIIGNLDEKGFLSLPLQELCHDIPLATKVLKHIQQCEPTGIGAFNTQHSLLLQLERKGQKERLAYRILRDHYDDFLHNRLPFLANTLQTPLKTIKACVQNEIRSLHLHPGYAFKNSPVPYIHPDLTIHEKEVSVNEQLLPSFKLSDQRLTPPLYPYLQGAKRVIEILDRRKSTLQKIGTFLLKKQQGFLIHQESLLPLSLRETAQALELHESTISRAVKDKYIDSSRGLLLLRDLFVSKEASPGYSEIKQLIHDLIQKENKHSPYSDEALARQLKQLGMPCARRTIAKYREELSIPHSSLRRQW